MRLEREVWKTQNGKDFAIGVVKFDSVDVARALDIVKKKIDHVNVHSPAGIKRNNEVIESRLLAGKLADHAVEYLINKCIIKKNLPFIVQEYDSVRCDNFISPDPYDILVYGNNMRYEVEVRSSFCYRLRDKESILDKLSCYGFYTSKTKGYEPLKDYYWQVVFHNVPRDISNAGDGLNVVRVFEDDVRNKCLEAYIVGGGPRSIFLSDQSEVRKDQDGAFYQSIYPISNGFDCDMLLRHMMFK
ncbi:hypothetical protein [Aeromonas veronii]|uniref:hypothetical protein n=1 Tax=Aeromonas veronii TaxID=654 RepID=UPI00406D0EE2|nr:hypothetical protein [Aeromonas veronii]